MPLGVNVIDSIGGSGFSYSADPTGPSKAKYVAGGALAGVALFGIGMVVYFRQSDSSEGLMSPYALLLPAAVAGGLGAFVGYLVYESRR